MTRGAPNSPVSPVSPLGGVGGVGEPFADAAFEGRGLLRVTGPGAYAAFLLFVVVHVSLTVFGVGGYRSTPVAFVSLAVIVAAALLVTFDGPQRLRGRVTVVVVALSTVASLGGVVNLPEAGWPGWTSWIWGAVTFVAFMLVLRRRTGAAWLAFVVMTAITLVWAVGTGRGALAGVNFVIRSAALLFVVSLFGVLLERTRVTIIRVQESVLERAVAEAAAKASLDEQNARLTQLRDQATPSLVRILSGDDLSDDDRRGFALVEAALRDQLRASGLARLGVVDAARRARSRGVSVSLLDDRTSGGPSSALVDDEWSRVEEAVVHQLDAAVSGQVTARLLPSGRDSLATIVADDEGDTVRLAVPAVPTAPSAIVSEGSTAAGLPRPDRA